MTAVDLDPSVGQSTHVAVLLSAYSATRSKTGMSHIAMKKHL